MEKVKKDHRTPQPSPDEKLLRTPIGASEGVVMGQQLELVVLDKGDQGYY